MGGEEIKMAVAATGATYPQLVTRPKGKKISHIYKERLRQFTSDGQYEEQSLKAKLFDARLSGYPHVKLHVWSAPGLTRPTFDDATREENEYRETKLGESFGPSWSTHWFRVQFTIPDQWSYKPQVELHWDSSSEAMVWTDDGRPLQGLTGGERQEWILRDEYRAIQKEHTIYIEMACNGMFGNAPGGDSIQPPNPDRYFCLNMADLVSVNQDARALVYDFWIIGDAAREFPNDSWEEHKALTVCNEIMDCFIAGEGSRWAIKDCRVIAKRYLGDRIDSANVYESESPALVQAIGHCHIDTCWLWPWAETKRKVARSWSNQCDLLDRYPEHRFCASQAQQYKWLEEHYPYVFDRVKSHVKSGRFHPIGGSWVEHDTNMPSGESLVRQFLYGQRYFESRFGRRCRTFWLPDTFGYSSQLPQLCRLAGMNRFFTQKLSWNNINNFPHTTFNWVSLDGSQVICHMAPSETYTAEAHFGDVSRSVTQHKSMDQDATSLLVFGKGDGGGGPTFGHLEKLRRCRGLSDQTGRLPRVQMGNSVDDFFDRLEQKAASGETEFVTWYHELYFELHRGTYTTQSANKRNNRQAEILLHDIEYLATLASLEPAVDYEYPKKEIDRMWEAVLLCQFHDCLPGSSIEMCYDDSDALYREVFVTGHKVWNRTLHALGFRTHGHPDERVAINTLGWERHGYSFSEPVAGETEAYVTLGAGGAVAAPSACPPGDACVVERPDGSFVLSNAELEVEVTDGVITRLFDRRAARDVLPAGAAANRLVVFDDKPLYWQAWDVELYHLESRRELRAERGSTRVTERRGARVAVTTRTVISEASWIETTIALPASCWAEGGDAGHIPSRVEVEAEVEWHEKWRFLKVEFPTNITNTVASYETQFGIVRRPTHYNTSWDMARFEVCHHKWADLSEHGYGVSILNDSRYGFATVGSLMRLSLLRSPKAPDAHADMGRHRLRWAILPHAGPLDHRSLRAAFEFNFPLRLAYRPRGEARSAAASGGGIAPASIFRFTRDSDPGLVLDTVKRAEDDADVVVAGGESCGGGSSSHVARKHVVLRVYEALGGRARGRVAVSGCSVLAMRAAWRCNLLEDAVGGEEGAVGRAADGTTTVAVELRAFEVQTWKVWVE